VFVEAGFILSILLALRRGKSGELTPERETAYLEAMQNCRGPSAPKVLRTTADVFQKYGCTLQATMLRRRADFLAAPESVQEQRRQVIKKAHESFSVEGIDELAAVFEYQTASGVARDLKARAAGIRAGEIKPDVVTPAPATLAPVAPVSATPTPATPTASTEKADLGQQEEKAAE
jgi:hypothetical protein